MDVNPGPSPRVENANAATSSHPLEQVPPGRYLTAEDGTRLHFLHWPAAEDRARAAVVLLHGIGGHAGWFAETAAYLAARGIAVYAPDRRGSGRSEGIRGHLARFEDALSDLRSMLDLVATEQPETPRFLAASSWAAKLAAMYAGQPSAGLSGLILLGPVLATRANLPLSKRLAVVVCGLAAPTRHVGTPVRQEMSTHNPNYLSWIRGDALQLKSATARFYWETVRMDRRRMRVAASTRLPVLVLQGEADPVADIEATRRWLAAIVSTDKTMKVYPGGGHVLDFEPDPTQYRSDFVDWVLARAGADSIAGSRVGDGQ